MFGFRWVFLISLVAFLASLTIILFFKEATYSKEASTHKELFLSGLAYIKKKKIVLYILLFGTLITGIVNSFYRYHSLYFQQINFSPQLIGTVFALMYFFAGLSGRISPWLEKKLGLRASLFLIPLVLGTTYIIMGSFPFYLVGFLIFSESVMAGFDDIILLDLRQRQLDSSKRSTLLSMQSFSENGMKIIISLFVGFGAAAVSLPFVYVVIGIFMVVAGIFLSGKIISYLPSR